MLCWGILPLTSKVTLPVFNSAAPVPVTLTAPPSPNSTATVNATSLDPTKLASNLADALIGGILGDALFNTGTPLTAAAHRSGHQLAAALVGGGGSNPQVTCVSEDAIRQCRVGAVSSLALTGGNQASGVLSVVVALLQRCWTCCRTCCSNC